MRPRRKGHPLGRTASESPVAPANSMLRGSNCRSYWTSISRRCLSSWSWHSPTTAWSMSVSSARCRLLSGRTWTERLVRFGSTAMCCTSSTAESPTSAAATLRLPWSMSDRRPGEPFPVRAPGAPGGLLLLPPLAEARGQKSHGSTSPSMSWSSSCVIPVDLIAGVTRAPRHSLVGRQLEPRHR